MNSRNIRKYKLSRDRFRQLYYFCLQYHSWQQELKEISELNAVNVDGMPHGSTVGAPTERLAIKRAEIHNKINIVEKCAHEAGGKHLYRAILLGVTVQNCTYNWLRLNGYAYCGKNQYYEARKYFYYLLDKEIL